MRVIITGQSGTRKETFATKLRNYVLQRRGISAQHPASKKEINFFEVENKEWLKDDFLNVLGNYNEYHASKTWSDAIRSINKTIKESEIKDCLLLTHATWYRNSRFFSPISWDALLLFQPDCVITLIDDLYDIWQRIEEGKLDIHLSLDEILAWRSVEISTSRSISLNLKLDPSILEVEKIDIPSELKYFFGSPIPHFIMSVKHPLETFYRLIFERSKRPVVYASFPITRTRQKRKRVEDINSFRKNLQDTGAIVVDPLMIDEMRMEKTDPAWLTLKEDSRFQEYQNKRWEIANPSVEPPTKYENPFRKLSTKQIKQTAERIEQHVVDRDYRLVSQCSILVAYRPFYPKDGDEIIAVPPHDSTGGVTREINFALDIGKAVWGFHPKCDWCSEQERKFFEELSMWHRVRRFPPKTKLAGLKNKDFTGFNDLLTEIKGHVKND